MFAFVFLAELLPFLFPLMICSEVSKVIAFDLYDGIFVIRTTHFLGCKSCASFHCFTPHFPKLLHG